MKVTISISEEVKQELDNQAKELGRTRSGHITELVMNPRSGVEGCNYLTMRHVWSNIYENCLCGQRGPREKKEVER